MALSAKALTTIANVKAYLKIPTGTTTQDTIIEGEINWVSDFIDRYLNRTLKSATYTNEYHVGDRTQFIVTKHYPITSVTSLYVDDILQDSDDYQVDDVKVYLPQGFARNAYVEGVSNYPVRPTRNIKMTYVAGYVLSGESRTLPYDIEQVAIQLSALRLNANDKTVFEMTPIQKDMLQPYRRYSI